MTWFLRKIASIGRGGQHAHWPPGLVHLISVRGAADVVLMRDHLYPYTCGAGEGAQSKYNAAAKRWRRRVFRKLRLPFFAVGIVLFVAEAAERHFGSWMLGLAFGVVVTVYMTLRESPPAHIEKWRTGAEGERRTAGALAPLRHRGVRLLHDLPDRSISSRGPCGNVDHVVISRAGVFLLDSKWLGGEASVSDDVVRVQMLDDEDVSYEMDRLAKGMRGRAARLREDISQQTGVRYVQAVVVFWNPFPDGVVEDKHVVYIAGDRLADWLGERRFVIAAQRVDEIADAILTIRAPSVPTWSERLRREARKLRGFGQPPLTT